MGRAQLARIRIEELEKRIRECERYRKILIDYLQKQKNKLLRREITYFDYLDLTKEKREGKTIGEWIEYYDKYIDVCKDRIEREKGNIFVSKIIFGFLAFFLSIILIISLLNIQTLIGFITKEQKQEFKQDLNLIFENSAIYEWKPENIGILESLKLSGLIEGEGDVKIYLDNILILDSSKLEGEKVSRGITALIIEEPEQTSELSNSEEKQKGASQNSEDSSPSQEEPPSPSESPAETVETIVENETNQEKEPIEEPNETKDEEIKEKEQEQEVTIKKFSNICEETCNLAEFNLNSSSYTLRIETSNAKLKIDSITYKIISEVQEKPETPTPTEIIEVPDVEIPEPTEVPEEIPEIIHEKNITEIPEIKENITEKPNLITNIPDIEIQKNTYGKININEYFQGAENFFILQIKNISTSSYDHTIKLVPDKEFLGTRTSKIIAVNKFGEGESNFFNITIEEFVSAPVLIKEIPDIQIQKNNFSEIDITEYFQGAEVYYLLQVQNISTATYDHTIKITPDKNFIGARKVRIIAENPLGRIESNEFNIIISEEIAEIIEIPQIPAEINVSTMHYKAVINKPTKWIKVVKAEKTDDIKGLRLELPKEAENISIKTEREVDEALAELEEYENIIETNKKDLITGIITGNVALDIKKSQGLFTRFFKWLGGFTITGNVINEEELQEEITETFDSKIVNIGEIVNQTQASTIGVEYYTSGPTAVEETTSRGKRVIVSGDEKLNYTDVLAFTSIDEKFSVGQENRIRIYWSEQNKYINFSAHDLDNNGKLDYVEWIVPHLSNQTFDIILITKAEHLNSNREFISDIYEEVKALDGIWSEEIPNQHYVRVTFQTNLTLDRDITLFPRTISGEPRIEVYEVDGNELIAEFTSLNDNQYNKVFLTNLQESQDTFDLRIIGGSLQLDYIVDPQVFSDDFETDLTKWDGNGATPWDLTTAQKHGGAQSILASNNNEDDLITDDIDTSSATSINVSFWFMESGTLESGDIDFYFFDGAAYDAITDTFEAGANDVWQFTSFTTTDTQYFKSNFRVNFNAVLGTGELFYVDDFVVNITTDTTAPLVTIVRPENKTYNGGDGGIIPFNFTLNEVGTCQYSLNAGVTNYTMTANASNTGFNATNTSIADGSYTARAYCNDTTGNKNYTTTRVFSKDTTYPIFSSYWDNNASLIDSGTALFNVTLQSTNGTVRLEINGQNYTASNISATIFNVSVSLSSSGVYGYYWLSWGNGTAKNYNVSALRYYTVNATLDNEYPNVTLNLPANASTLTYTNVTFNCSTYDNSNLKNVTLYFNSTGGGSGGGSITLVQQKNYSHVYNDATATSIGVNLTAPPTADNLLVTIIASDKNAGTYTAPTGFTIVHTTSATSISGALAYKISAGTEQNITWNFTTAGADSSVWYGEYSGLATSNVLDISSHNTTFSGADTATTVITAQNSTSTSQADELAIALATIDTPFNCDTGRSWSNGFTEVDFAYDNLATSGTAGISISSKTLSSTGAQSTVYSCSDTGDQMYAILATFKAASGGVAWHANQTNAVSGTSNNTVFYLNLTNSSYNWNCLATDAANNRNFSAANYTFTINTTVVSENSAPQIISVTSIANTDPLEDNIRNIIFNFSVYDANGVGDLNSSTAMANFTLSGEALRQNTTCSQVNANGNYANYSCTIGMWYFDGAGAWGITAFIQDNSSTSAINDTTTFQYNELTAMKMALTALTWPAIALTDTNIKSNNDPIRLNNTGNDNNTGLVILITGKDLWGETTTTQAIFAANFTVDETDACDAGPAMQNATNVTITGALLPKGNHSVNNGTSGQEDIYFCLEALNPDLSSQSYSTGASGAWVISVALAVFVVAGRSTARRKKRKEIKEDNLVKAMALIVDELREKYSLSKVETMNLIVKELKEKYKLSKKEIINVLGIEKNNIPVGIFSKELGGLEALVKYMKENLGMNYREISKELNRNERTIWTAYKKSTEKKKEPIKVKDIALSMPIEIFKDRRFTVLESVILYLREKGMKHKDIAKILDRDQRNIQTIYSRAVRKLNKK